MCDNYRYSAWHEDFGIDHVIERQCSVSCAMDLNRARAHTSFIQIYRTQTAWFIL